MAEFRERGFQKVGRNLIHLARFEVCEHERTVAHPDQPVHCQANGLQRAAHFALLAFRQRHRQPGVRAHLTVEGVKYQPIKAVFDREMGANSWLTVTLTEGKNREVRKALESVGLTVNRLIRVSYGPFVLADLKPGQVDEVPPDLLETALAELGHKVDSAPARPAPAPKSHLGRRGPSTRVKGKRT